MISPNQCVQEAVMQSVQKLSGARPHTRVGLITFNNQVLLSLNTFPFHVHAMFTDAIWSVRFVVLHLHTHTHTHSLTHTPTHIHTHTFIWIKPSFELVVLPGDPAWIWEDQLTFSVGIWADGQRVPKGGCLQLSQPTSPLQDQGWPTERGPGVRNPIEDGIALKIIM